MFNFRLEIRDNFYRKCSNSGCFAINHPDHINLRHLRSIPQLARGVTHSLSPHNFSESRDFWLGERGKWKPPLWYHAMTYKQNNDHHSACRFGIVLIDVRLELLFDSFCLTIVTTLLVVLFLSMIHSEWLIRVRRSHLSGTPIVRLCTKKSTRYSSLAVGCNPISPTELAERFAWLYIGMKEACQKLKINGTEMTQIDVIGMVYCEASRWGFTYDFLNYLLI